MIDSGMQAVSCDWNHDGTVFAVCGIISNIGEEKESNQVMFYTFNGIHLRTLKLPGQEITSLSWEGKSLRIALGVDSYIYFANIRPDYMWCYFGHTICFLKTITGKHGSSLVFWDTASNQCFTKQIDTPLGLAANNDHCVVALESIKFSIRDTAVSNDLATSFRDKVYQLIICNTMSTTVDARYINICPYYIAMNLTFIIVASKEQFLLWHYHTPKGASSLHGIKHKKDKCFHIDDTPSGVTEVLNDLDRGGYEPPVNTEPSKDPICCIGASEELLLIARESGAIQEYTIPNVVLCNRHILSKRACKITINCNSTRAAVIDIDGRLTTIDLVNNSEASMVPNKVERKDVWAMCWAKDNPQLLAIMEKTRMYVLKGADPEEPISCSGYICHFEDLEIKGVLLDDIVNGTMSPDSNQHLLQLRIKSLRDTEELLAHVGIVETKQFIEDNSHPRLWRLLAEASLKKLDLDVAESAFVRCTNYPGLQFIKHLRAIDNQNLQKAEIFAFYGDYDEAEKLYVDSDRRDLAIKLRQTLCDWFRTVNLYRQGSSTSNQLMEHAWSEIGNHFASSRSWESAKEYYEKAHAIEGVMESLYHLEQYDELEKCIDSFPEKSPLLGKLGRMLESVGCCNQAVMAYLKFGDVRAAVNACVNLRNWAQAVELAQKYEMPQVGVLLDKHAAQLLKEEKLPEAIELQRKAGRFLDAARLMLKLAEGESVRKSSLLRIKQIYILAGSLVENHLKIQASLTSSNRSTILTNLSPEDSMLIESIWHRAEAYHFLMLAQRQLSGGLMHSAVLTSLRLREYEDVLDPEHIYALLALASCADRSFGICSKAFIKLDGLEFIPENRRLEYEELAVNIFSKYEPKDIHTERTTNSCSICVNSLSDWDTSCPACATYLPVCIASGQSVNNPANAWQCTGCHHIANRLDIAARKTCPLCHTPVVSRGIEL